MIRNSRNYISDHLATKQNKSHEMLANVTPHVTQSQNVPYIQVQYKNPKPGEAVNEYHGRGFVTIERAVHKLVVLIPKEEAE